MDAEWDATITPLLRHRFPHITPEDLKRARAFAYGGSVIQDLGYYPFGNHLFTNLVHYVRSGDFVEALIRSARTSDEYAFALGALAHYTSDNIGHRIAVNRSVPLVYPKLRAKYGDEVTYAESPKRHIMMEFAFDVVQLAGGAYLPQSYRDFIGFQVATPALERAFRQTYGLEMKDVFADLDLAIGTYRFAAAKTIPEMTHVAWREKRPAIEALTPQVTQSTFVYTLTRREYEQAFGTKYRRPGVLARMLVFLFKVIPKVGPLRPLAFTPPTPEAEHLFLESFAQARERYRRLVESLNTRPASLPNTDFDTGHPTVRGEYRLADETYADLLDKLSKNGFASASPALRRNINSFYRAGDVAGPVNHADRKLAARARMQLAAMNTNRR